MNWKRYFILILRPRPGDFDYILEEHEQPDRQPEEPMDKFVTVRKKSMTIQDTRKPVTPLPVTEDSPRNSPFDI